MARRPRLEDTLAAVRRLGDQPHAAGAEAALRDALRSKTGLVVAAAAAIVGEHRLEALAGELPAAYQRLTERPLERDPGCRGKAAALRALHDLDHWDEVFAAAASLVQAEPAWNGSVDTAAEARAIAGYAHAHLGRSDALDVLAALLADPERSVRAAAATALGDAGHADATALLRFKILLGDDEAEVLTACHGSLLALAATSLPFVAAQLGRGGERAAAAALALGESRLEAAVAPLVAWCDAPGADVRVGFLALALVRHEAATRHLLELVARDPQVARARAAIDALATFKDDRALADRVLAAAAASDAPAVRAHAQGALAVRT